MTRHYYITPEDYATAAECGICARTLESRVRGLGWDVDRAISEPPKVQRSYPEWRELAKQNGVSSDTFYYRFGRGWELERAATTPPLTRQEAMTRAASTRRKIPAKIRALADANGIKRSTFYGRIRDCGWTPERAATEPVWTQEQASVYGNARLRELRYHTTY
ncbi:hypothetical protein [Paenibacillus lycopersici]|uniref:hypothetical protein n=1 Tax=Paenibacillus lycopersici TaxID=2704462 RepID=UPI001CDCD748|nr:hypothetical protein [Paenibacillus lycopersici]